MSKEKIIKIVIALVVIVIMLLPIINDMHMNNSLKELAFNKYTDVISNTSNYGFALIYIGKDDVDVKANIKKIMDGYSTSKTSVYFMNADGLSEDETFELLGVSKMTDAYIFIANGEVIKVFTESLNDKLLEAYISEYSVSYIDDTTVKPIDESLVYYKTLERAKDYKNLVNNKKLVTMAVFGRDTCYYCNQFKPVYNTVAEEYDLDIYYFDSDSYNKDEYKNIMDMGLIIPGSCRKNGVEAKMSDGFATPLTIFTKNGKVIDCISGYKNKQSLITKLKTVGMIKEEE